MSGRVSVTSADFIRNVGHWQNEALRRPISITHHGRERLVLAAPQEIAVAAFADSASAEAVRADTDAVVENLEDGFIAFDASLCVRRSNAIAEAFIGRSREMLRGATVADVLPAPLGAVLHDRLQRVLRTRKREAFDAAIDNRHIAVRVFPLSEGAAMLFANTTEQFDQRLQLSVGSALCAAADMHPQAAAATLDAAGIVIAIHADFCAWLGVERDELIGQSLLDLAAPAQRGGLGDVFAAVVAGTEAQHVNVALLGKHGRKVQGMLALAAIRSGAASRGVVVVMVPQQDANPARSVSRQVSAEPSSIAGDFNDLRPASLGHATAR